MIVPHAPSKGPLLDCGSFCWVKQDCVRDKVKIYRTYVVSSEDAVSRAIVKNLDLPLTVTKALCCVKAAHCIFRLKILNTLEGVFSSKYWSKLLEKP